MTISTSPSARGVLRLPVAGTGSYGRVVYAHARLRTVARRLHVGRAYHVGRNFWYLAPYGRGSGLLKVRHGRIEEVGIAVRRLTRSRALARRFLRSFS